MDSIKLNSKESFLKLRINFHFTRMTVDFNWEGLLNMQITLLSRIVRQWYENEDCLGPEVLTARAIALKEIKADMARGSGHPPFSSKSCKIPKTRFIC